MTYKDMITIGRAIRLIDPSFRWIGVKKAHLEQALKARLAVDADLLPQLSAEAKSLALDLIGQSAAAQEALKPDSEVDQDIARVRTALDKFMAGFSNSLHRIINGVEQQRSRDRKAVDDKLNQIKRLLR